MSLGELFAAISGGHPRQRKPHAHVERTDMLFLLAAVLVFWILLGTVAHVPAPVSLIAAAVICGWLIQFTIHERRTHRRNH
jgi:Flp pilus assembly protein TadB